MRRNNFYILTGAPGVGKTTLIQRLMTEFDTVEEPARKVITEQRRCNGSGLWDKDRELFIKLLLERSIESYLKTINQGAIFFDRGIPDNVAYASYGDVDILIFREATKKYLSNQKVFLLQPWEKIYENDDERTMSFSDVIDFHQHIIAAYCDYDLIIVPNVSVEERVEFIKANL